MHRYADDDGSTDLADVPGQDCDGCGVGPAWLRPLADGGDARLCDRCFTMERPQAKPDLFDEAVRLARLAVPR